MPIYAYRCEACGHAKDVLQKISEPILTVCPACGAEAFKKQLTAAGFQLKGSGWYVTDFRGGAQPPGGTAANANVGKTDAASTEAAKPDAAAASPAPAASAAPAAAPAPSSGPAPAASK